MVWRRVLVPSGCTLREPHGVFQVAMGWEGTHLYQFCLRAARYGSWELCHRDLRVLSGQFDQADTNLWKTYDAVPSSANDNSMHHHDAHRGRVAAAQPHSGKAQQPDLGHCHINIGRAAWNQRDDVAPIMRPGGRSSPAARY